MSDPTYFKTTPIFKDLINAGYQLALKADASYH